jgi:hypothetical protein
MNNKFIISVRERAHKAIVAFRVKLNLRPRFTMAEIAQNVGLTVQNLENQPADFEGFVDWCDKPRFIAVNRNLLAHKKAWFIARQIAFCAQQRRCNSVSLDRPWKWAMLDNANQKLRNKILLLDEENRAHFFMVFCSTGDEFRAYVREDPKKVFWTIPFADIIVSYHLSKLWVKNWFNNLYRKLVFGAFPSS